MLYSEDPSGKEMVDLIKKFLDRVIQSGGKINVAKSELMRTHVKYLGFMVGKDGRARSNTSNVTQTLMYWYSMYYKFKTNIS